MGKEKELSSKVIRVTESTRNHLRKGAANRKSAPHTIDSFIRDLISHGEKTGFKM